MIEGIFERMSIPMLEKALNIISFRQKVIAGNIANAVTPGYVSKEVNFEESLSKAMGRKELEGLTEDRKHIPIGNDQKDQKMPVVVKGTRSGDVNFDREMASSAENQLFYSAVANFVRGSFKDLKTCIRGRA